MRTQLLEFLKLLERKIPPPNNSHHAVTYAQYGSDEIGWHDRLALQVNSGGVFECYFIDENDSIGPDLVAKIVELHSRPMITAQLGVALGQYIP